MKYKNKLNRIFHKKLLSNFFPFRLGSDVLNASKCHPLSNTTADISQVIIFHLKNAAWSIRESERSDVSVEKKKYFTRTLFHLHQAQSSLVRANNRRSLTADNDNLYNALSQIIENMNSANCIEKIYEIKCAGSVSIYLEQIERLLLEIDNSIDNLDVTVVKNMSYNDLLSKLSNFSAKEVSS